MSKIYRIGVGLLLLSTTPKLRSEWFFEVGPVYRGDMSIEVDGGSRAKETNTQIGAPGITRTAPTQTGSPGEMDDGSAQILRTFEDGFVGPSGLPLFSGIGQTQYFGFESDSQHNSTAGTLSFTSVTSSQSQSTQTRSRLESAEAGWSGKQSFDGVGLQATTGYILRKDEHLEVSLFGQVAWLGDLDANFQGKSAYQQKYTEEVRETTVTQYESRTFVFDTFGNPVFPSGPYEMTDASGVGPLISDRPIDIVSAGSTETSSEEVVGRSLIRAQSQVDLRMEADLSVFTLGPRVRWQLNEQFSFLLQGGATLNYLKTTLYRSETFATEAGTVLGSWQDRRNDTQWLPGLSASAGVQWDLTDQLYLNASGGYDWVDDAKIDIGPDDVSLDLSSYKVELSIGWRLGKGVESSKRPR